MYIEYYLMGIILLPAIIFSAIAQSKVNSTYKRYSKIASQKGLTAKDVAKAMLEKHGILDVEVKKVSGKLTDYYSDADKCVALSEDIYDSTSVSAIGIAMHEVGHAIQYEEGYGMVKARNFMTRVCNLSNKLLWPLVIIGLIFNFGVEGGGILGSICLWAGIGFFTFAIIFNLVTLPVEYNASNRARKLMATEDLLTKDELKMASKVLSAAALTYVAAFTVSILNFFRFLLVMLIGGRKK
jgi:hypothetical protein